MSKTPTFTIKAKDGDDTYIVWACACCREHCEIVMLTSNSPRAWYVECNDCGARGPICSTPEMAVQEWNGVASFMRGAQV